MDAYIVHTLLPLRVDSLDRVRMDHIADWASRTSQLLSDHPLSRVLHGAHRSDSGVHLLFVLVLAIILIVVCAVHIGPVLVVYLAISVPVTAALLLETMR